MLRALTKLGLRSLADMATEASLKIARIAVGPFQENAYLLWDDSADKKPGIYIDPGDEAEKLAKVAAERGVQLEGIYLTHGHLDHIGAVSGLKKAVKGLKCYVHKEDEFLVANLPKSCKMYGLPEKKAPKVDGNFEEGSEICFGSVKASVLHTPGHSPGGCCFFFEDSGACFVGDTIFQSSVGRSDLPGGDHRQLVNSIKEKLMVLPKATVLLPGHGPQTSVEKEKKSNPFIR